MRRKVGVQAGSVPTAAIFAAAAYSIDFDYLVDLARFFDLPTSIPIAWSARRRALRWPGDHDRHHGVEPLEGGATARVLAV